MKYKKLVVSGCSFTQYPNSWAYVLAKKYNLELVNLAAAGAGNTHISNSLILYLTKEKPDPTTTLIGVMWSNPARHDFLVNCNKNFQDIQNYSYDSFNKLVMSNSLINKYQINRKTLSTTDAFNLIMFPGYESVLTRSWMNMQHTVLFLLDKKYNFFHTSFLDIFNNTNNKFFNKDLMPYKNVLKMLRLPFDDRNYLNLQPTELLGEYATIHNLLDTDDMHPSSEGQIKWTENILIPELNQIGIL